MSHQKICPQTKIKKSVGAYTTLNIRIYIYIYIGVQIIKYKILKIENLTTFFTSGGNRAYIYTILGKCVCWVLQYNNCGTNIWKFLGDFLLDHYFKNLIEGVPHTRGHTPYFILG